MKLVKLGILAVTPWLFGVSACVWVYAQEKTSSTSVAPNFTLKVVPVTESIRVGSPVQVTVTVKNISGKQMPWRSDFADTAYQAFRFLLTKDGQQLEKTAFHRKLRGEQRPGDPAEVENGSSIVSMVAPGKSFTFSIDLARLYTMKEPGEYTLRISRVDDSSGATVFSNSGTVSLVR